MIDYTNDSGRVGDDNPDEDGGDDDHFDCVDDNNNVMVVMMIILIVLMILIMMKMRMVMLMMMMIIIIIMMIRINYDCTTSFLHSYHAFISMIIILLSRPIKLGVVDIRAPSQASVGVPYDQ